LADDTEPTAVLRCIETTEHVAGDGEWSVTVRQRATGPTLQTLLAALRQPSEPRTADTCTLELRYPREVELETASGIMSATAPTDSCGQTTFAVVRAFQQLDWVEVSRVRGHQLRPEALVAAGCDAWKDMLAISAKDSHPEGPGELVPDHAAVRVCTYRSTYPAGWTPSSNEEVDGEPVGGGPLSAADSATVARLLGAAGPAAACDQVHHMFAVVFVAESAQDTLYVELDGCRRILASDGSLRQGEQELSDLLASAST
jgi:hypothetical protein